MDFQLADRDLKGPRGSLFDGPAGARLAHGRGGRRVTGAGLFAGPTFAPGATFAAATASKTSSADANGTRAVTSPVAGFVTSPKRPLPPGVVRPPIPTDRRGKLREDVARVTQYLANELEYLIRRAPEQWHLFQPNWPSDPGYGEPPR